ncbi:unnamed protein product [Oncorhynchus mykiss]|uniref:ubiquitinyl hydrolase 1 n=1 Tax=Oncorhynchus mykiss TaxID=8022 RepID=A0A060WWP1_ONCMY|nr:unnamed protein product [Oncorhynchus mykiss]
MFTALWHRRRALMGRVFHTWFSLTEGGKRREEEERQREEEERRRKELRERRKTLKRQLQEALESAPPRKSHRLRRASQRAAAAAAGDSPLKRRPTVTPGVTGLRNLGNTECFLRLDLTQALELLASAVHGQLVVPSPGGPVSSFPLAQRRGPQVGAGLSGGASRAQSMELIQPKEPSSKHISLCHELHTLFQVMWSGKWALVSPFAMLHSVWQLIPAFRGYAQQDAQEFLCELLDKVQHELESTGTHTPPAGVSTGQRHLIKQVLSIVNTIFHGQLLSQVTCLACDHRSNTVEPFWDLSLEFPERYHSNSRESAAQVSCQLTEMLAKFTETEALEGNIYACDQCNSE